MKLEGCSVDCAQCVNLKACGGHPTAGFWGCYDYCREKCDGHHCEFTCPNNEPEYSQRMLEVGGYRLDKIESLIPARLDFPSYVPAIHARTDRDGPSSAAWVAVPLVKLFRGLGQGQIGPAATTPEGLRKLFGLRPDARIIGNGVGPDSGIEWIWHHYRTAPFAQWLRDMGIEAITCPNYSYFGFLPRDHFMWNRKRMYLFCQELGRAGFPVIPHLYGDTAHDWKVSAQMYRDHPLLDTFAVEFQTDDGDPVRLSAILENLELFRDAVGRPLTIVAVGARHLAEDLALRFPSLVIIEASAYFKTIWRRFALVRASGKLGYQPTVTVGAIDSLLDHNNRVIGGWTDAAVARGRARRAKIQKAAAQPSSLPEPGIPSSV